MSSFEEAVVDIKNARDVVDGLVSNQNPDGSEMKHPDPKKHQYISFVKSVWRIIAGVALCFSPDTYIMLAGASLVVAEILGIVEELV